MKNKYSLILLILFIYTINLSKAFASKKDINYKFILDNKLKFNEKEIITKKNTKKWINAINNRFSYYQTKIKINKDYLKLIKRFPSNKNITPDDIYQNLRKYTIIKNGLLEKRNALNNLYKFLSSEEYFDIYIVIYHLKFLNYEELENINFDWFSLCSLNSNYDKEIFIVRKNLLPVFYYLGHEGYPSYENSIRYSRNLGLSESMQNNLHKKVCNEFKKKNNGFIDNNN